MKSVKNDCFLLIPWSINERRRYLSIFCRSRANLKSLVSFSRWIEVKESGLWNNNFFYYKFREIFVFVSHRLLLDVSFKNVICCFFGWMPNDLQRKVVKTSSIKNQKLWSQWQRPMRQTTLCRKGEGDQQIYIFFTSERSIIGWKRSFSSTVLVRLSLNKMF